MSSKKNYRPIEQHYVNYYTGLIRPSRATIEEQIVSDYKFYSHNYWQGVFKRQKIYREKQLLKKIIS
jgi:hypothetical protein